MHSALVQIVLLRKFKNVKDSDKKAGDGTNLHFYCFLSADSKFIPLLPSMIDPIGLLRIDADAIKKEFGDSKFFEGSILPPQDQFRTIIVCT